MTEISRLRAGATAVVDEAYAFVCMHCGHGWEQAYEIEHHTDADGRAFVVYVADGRIVRTRTPVRVTPILRSASSRP